MELQTVAGGLSLLYCKRFSKSLLKKLQVSWLENQDALVLSLPEVTVSSSAFLFRIRQVTGSILRSLFLSEVLPMIFVIPSRQTV